MFIQGATFIPDSRVHCQLVSSGISSQSVRNILIWHVTENERPILVLYLLRFSEMTYELIIFNHLRCHSSSPALGTRTGYRKPTWRGTGETPLSTCFAHESMKNTQN